MRNREWIPLNKRDHLSTLHMCGIANVTMVPQLLYTLITVFFKIYSSDLIIPEIINMLILSYGSLAGFIIPPILGAFSDSIKLKWGRRRIFITIGCFLSVLSLSTIAFQDKIADVFNATLNHRKIIFYVSIMICFTAANILQLPAIALCFDVTPNCQKLQMANIIQVFESLGSIIINLFGTFGISVYRVKSNELVFIVSSFIIFITCLITIFSAREEPLTTNEPFVNPFKKIGGALKNMPKPFKTIILPFFFAYMAIYQYQFKFSEFMRELYIDHYCMDKDGNIYISFAMLCLLVAGICQLIYSFLNAKVVEKIGVKITMIIGLSIVSVCLFLFFYITNRYFYVFNSALIGIGSVIFSSISKSVVSLIVPYQDMGANLGLLNCFCVLGQQISNFCIYYLVLLCSENNVTRNLIASSSIPALFGAISAFFMNTSRTIDADYNQIDDSPREDVLNIENF